MTAHSSSVSIGFAIPWFYEIEQGLEISSNTTAALSEESFAENKCQAQSVLNAPARLTQSPLAFCCPCFYGLLYIQLAVLILRYHSISYCGFKYAYVYVF